MNNLYFLIGLPRSGKSTIAQEWVMDDIVIKDNKILRGEYDILSSKPKVIVCADKIRLACGHRWNSYIEGYVHSCKYTMIRALLYDHDVLVDETHTTAKSIIQLFEICSDAQYLYVDTHPSICEARAIETGQSDLIPVITRMHDQLLRLANVNAHDDIEKNIGVEINKLKRKAIEQRIND